jgi:hypothetical protein
VAATSSTSWTIWYHWSPSQWSGWTNTAPFSVDCYLDETFKEHNSHRHKIRSITALRYPWKHPEQTSSALASHVAPTARDMNEDGFPAAELLASLPYLFERSDYKAFGAGKFRRAMRQHLRALQYPTLRWLARGKYHSTKEGGWICAMFVDKVYALAGIELYLVGIDELRLNDGSRFVTPRDLIDSPSLAPVVTLLVKPDPVVREVASKAPHPPAAMASDGATPELFPYELPVLRFG